MKFKLSIVFLFVCLATLAQQRETENLIIITLDGFRWQELFKGADSSILFNPTYKDPKAIASYWEATPSERRAKLLPFMWEVMGTQGQVYGNRELNNDFSCANPHWFSYPGYSELFTGLVDRSVKSNEKIVNPTSNVLEFVNGIPDYHGKVAVFSTWDVLPYILRAEPAGIVTNCGRNFAKSDSPNQTEQLLDDLQQLMNPEGERLDVFTFYYAFEYLKKERPRVLHIGLDETDQHGHGGRYGKYLSAANQADQMIEKLWNWIQTQQQYQNKTTLIITTDHGRGKGAKNAWRNHGRLAAGSGQMWAAVIGPDTPPSGEINTTTRYFQKQLAKTMASFLGLDYSNVEPVGDVIESMFAKPASISSR